MHIHRLYTIQCMHHTIPQTYRHTDKEAQIMKISVLDQYRIWCPHVPTGTPLCCPWCPWKATFPECDSTWFCTCCGLLVQFERFRWSLSSTFIARKNAEGWRSQMPKWESWNCQYFHSPNSALPCALPILETEGPWRCRVAISCLATVGRKFTEGVAHKSEKNNEDQGSKNQTPATHDCWGYTWIQIPTSDGCHVSSFWNEFDSTIMLEVFNSATTRFRHPWFLHLEGTWPFRFSATVAHTQSNVAICPKCGPTTVPHLRAAVMGGPLEMGVNYGIASVGMPIHTVQW